MAIRCHLRILWKLAPFILLILHYAPIRCAPTNGKDVTVKTRKPDQNPARTPKTRQMPDFPGKQQLEEEHENFANPDDICEDSGEWICLREEEGEAATTALAQRNATSSNASEEEMLKRQQKAFAGGGRMGMSTKWAGEFMQHLQRQQKQKAADQINLSSKSAIRRTEQKLSLATQQFNDAINEVVEDWRLKVGRKQQAQMEKDFERMARKKAERQRNADTDGMPPISSTKAQMRKLYGELFDTGKFVEDALADKACDEEPLQLAEYYLFPGSNKLGLYHAGLLVCGIEIHYHRTGINFWKPMEYSTKAGGIHRNYRSIYHDGHELYTHKSFREIVALVNEFKDFFNASTYNMVTRNCLWFLRIFVRQLTGLTTGKIDWPWSAIHPLKKPYFMLMNKLKKP